MDERTVYPASESVDHLGEADPRQRAMVAESVDFASRQAARCKTRLRLAVLTGLAAAAIVVVVSMSALHPG